MILVGVKKPFWGDSVLGVPSGETSFFTVGAKEVSPVLLSFTLEPPSVVFSLIVGVVFVGGAWVTGGVDEGMSVLVGGV